MLEFQSQTSVRSDEGGGGGGGRAAVPPTVSTLETINDTRQVLPNLMVTILIISMHFSLLSQNDL